MRKIFLILFFFVFAFFLNINSYAQGNGRSSEEERLEAVVLQTTEEREVETEGQKQLYQKLEILVTKGTLKGKNIIVENGNISAASVIDFKKGDRIIVSRFKDFENKDVFYITDSVRRTPLYWLFGIFLGLTVLIGGKRGAASILGMVFSFFVIFFFLLLQISQGKDPVFIAILSSIFIVPVNFYSSHGFSRKTTSAVLGTVISLVITGILANFFVEAAKLSGFASEEAGFVEALTPGLVNIKGLLLAGIIVGALGILDDITIAQASVVNQLREAGQKLSSSHLFVRAMDVGRDHIASVVNTLILVYTGAALPLLLLFINNPLPFSEVINYEILAEEIVRTLVASIGLILAVPITTFLAVHLVKKK